MYRFFKRTFDIIISLIGLIILSPVMIIVALLVVLTSKGPALFKQNRIGAGKRVFLMYKFRSMRTDTPKDMPTHLLNDPDRFITPVGRFIRKTSLDELPQLFNIIAGDMSIIGPRPALPNQTDLIAERDKYGANDIRPGLTGWAQINGRDELPIPVKAAYDGEYCRKMSFVFDLKCFFLTIIKVLRSDGIVEGAAPVSPDSDNSDAKESPENPDTTE